MSVRITSCTFLFSRGSEEFPKGNDPDEALLPIEDIDVVDRRDPLAGLPTQVPDRFVDVHIGTQARIAGIHQPPGLVLGIVEQGAYFCTGDLVKQSKESGARFLWHFLYDVCRIVRREEAHPQAAFAFGKGEE